MALRPIDIVLQAKDNASGVFGKVADSAGQMGGSIVAQGARIQQALTDSAGGADLLSASLGKAGDSAGNLSGNLERLRNGGAVLAGLGAAGLALGEHFIGAGLEADRLNAKMSTLLSGAGISGASDQIKKLAGDLAGLTGGDDDTIAASLASAIASGRVMGLKEYGIVLSGTAKEAIKAASEISDLAGKQETLNQVMLAGGQAVQDLRDHTDSATASLGSFNVRWGNVEESVGMGAARAKASILGGLLDPILSVVEASPQLQDAAGYFEYVGSGALAAGGSVLGLASQVGMLTLAFPEMGASAAAAFAAIRTGAAAALGPVLALAAGLTIGAGLGHGLNRYLQGGSIETKWADLNKIMNDPKSSKDLKTRAVEEAIRDFGAAGFNEDVNKLQEKHVELTGQEYDQAAEKMQARMAKTMAKIRATMPTSGAGLDDESEGEGVVNSKAARHLARATRGGGASSGGMAVDSTKEPGPNGLTGGHWEIDQENGKSYRNYYWSPQEMADHMKKPYLANVYGKKEWFMPNGVYKSKAEGERAIRAQEGNNSPLALAANLQGWARYALAHGATGTRGNYGPYQGYDTGVGTDQQEDFYKARGLDPRQLADAVDALRHGKGGGKQRPAMNFQKTREQVTAAGQILIEGTVSFMIDTAMGGATNRRTQALPITPGF